MFWLGDQQWRFYLQFEKGPCDRAVTFQDHAATLQFLFTFRSDAFALARFRTLVPASERSGQRLSDEQLLRKVAKKLISGELRVCKAKMETYGGHGTPPDPAIPLFDVSERRKYEPEPSVKKQSDDSFSDGDLVAIAAVLKAAAESGVPFCEECERAAAAAAAGN